MQQHTSVIVGSSMYMCMYIRNNPRTAAVFFTGTVLIVLNSAVKAEGARLLSCPPVLSAGICSGDPLGLLLSLVMYKAG